MFGYLSLEACRDRHLYRIRSRNLDFGVYRADRKGFLGLREKFGDVYPFTEYHYDTGAPCGTVKPVEELSEVLPDVILLNEGFFGCKLCRKPARAIPGEVVYKPGDTPVKVPCHHEEHVEPTDCPASSSSHFSVYWQNEDLVKWLKTMEKKYSNE